MSADRHGPGVLFDVGYCLMDESARLDRALAWLVDALAAQGRTTSVAALGEGYGAVCRSPSPDEPSLVVQLLVETGLPRQEAYALRRALPWDAAPLEPFPDTLSALLALRQAGFRVGVLANQPASARADLDRAGVSALCDGIWLSGDVGLAKPDARLFRLALDAWALPPRRVAYIGDRPDNDVGPARTLGMATVRLHRGPHADQPARGERETADMDAGSLTGAAERLLEWRAMLGEDP